MRQKPGTPMKILVLTKRQYMGKDLLDDRFGRFRELPLALARLGHRIMGVALSYRKRDEGTHVDFGSTASNGHVTWHSANLTNGLTLRLRKPVAMTVQLVSEFKPDLVWACSDVYQVIFGTWVAKRAKTKCVVDLYDNFEAFTASKLPLVRPLFRRAVNEAHGVTCFSQRLADYVVKTYGRIKPMSVIENGTRKDLFYQKERKACRQRLGLPGGVQIIGTAGALHSSRGIDTLFRAFELLAAENQNLHLALAGSRERRLRIPTGPRVHDLGVLRQEDVPFFITSLDLAVICYRQSAQGKYSFPQKAYEIVACRVPLIAAAVGSMNEFMSDYPGCLYEPENPKSLADAARRQLQNRIIVDKEVPSWADSAKKLELFFDRIIQGDRDNVKALANGDVDR
jgi:glycosyltransferase involved in cell wall biosynthesis